MKDDKLTGDYRVCVNEADAFLSVAKYCVRSIEDFLGGKMYPFAVNISFACELYLKAVMIRRSTSSEYVRGHDLKQLFESLETGDRDEIRHMYEKKCPVPQFVKQEYQRSRQKGHLVKPLCLCLLSSPSVVREK